MTRGKSIQSVVRYNEQKRSQGKAELIAHQGFFKGVEQLSTKQLGKRFEARLVLNRRTKTNALQISLNFAPWEKLDQPKLEEISKAYLERIGFGGQPCLIYQHHDAGHPHVHLVTVNIDAAGKRIGTHNLARNQSEKARKELEQKYGLAPAEKRRFTGPAISQLGKLEYGAQPTMSGMDTVLNQVWHNYVFSSLGEFNAILRGYGMEADPGRRDSRRFRWGGLVYRILDSEGKGTGVPIKASSFHLKPTLKNLEAKFRRDRRKKENLMPQVRARIQQEASLSASMKQLEVRLKKKGIYLSLNYTTTGQLFGVTYVDHGLRIAVKGSSLSRELGPTGLREQFEQPGAGIIQRYRTPNGTPEIEEVRESVETEASDPGDLTPGRLSLDLGNLSDSAYQGGVSQAKKQGGKKDKIMKGQ